MEEGSKKKLKIWLMALTGPEAGTRYQIKGKVWRIGRDPSSDLVPGGRSAAAVSSKHLVITQEGRSFRLRDLNSTNGTYVNDQRVEDATLEDRALIALGPSGPRFQFVVEEVSTDSEKTAIQPRRIVLNRDAERRKRKAEQHDAIIENAVERARAARDMGKGGQTSIIMREVILEMIRRSRRNLKIAVVTLLFLLLLGGSWSWLTIGGLRTQKTAIDGQINRIEAALAAADEPEEIDALIKDLENYQSEARGIQKNLFYKLGVHDREDDFINGEIKAILVELGTDAYSFPPEFTKLVRKYIGQYQNRDRRNMERALITSRKELELMRSVLAKNHLPPDLAYMVLVETGFKFNSRSQKGAVGPWQMRVRTARAYGLKIGDGVDERLDPEKSTQAASSYLRSLIADFGIGNSAMLALAAYNLGPTRVRAIIRKVENPIKQRNFWYLYRTRALPPETREYVPKVIAAIIVGRNPERFNFQTTAI